VSKHHDIFGLTSQHLDALVRLVLNTLDAFPLGRTDMVLAEVPSDLESAWSTGPAQAAIACGPCIKLHSFPVGMVPWASNTRAEAASERQAMLTLEAHNPFCAWYFSRLSVCSTLGCRIGGFRGGCSLILFLARQF
jgi:hypothetical protein